MIFPNVKVQPHWLATLERAKEALPSCRFVCAALYADVEPEIEKDIREAITEAIAPVMLVNIWYYRETGEPLRCAREYRIAWLEHMISKCRT